MDKDLDDLLARLRGLEAELEEKFEEQRAAFQYTIDRRRVVFEESVRQRHRQIRTGILTFLRHSPLLSLLSAPIIYALMVPIVLLDVSVSIYQLICFPMWGVPRVGRADYVIIDRHYLAYLNGVQKLNCVYCGYANGVIAFTAEIAARTEKYWCPIKHARRVRTPHGHYRDFLDYGDDEDLAKKLEKQRRDLMDRG